jgi:adenosylmethionine-8-amino-7-oxononanoate aminotransferase
MACAAALQVQRIIEEDNLVANVANMGKLLSSLLEAAISHHPNVGDIRGRGLFWGIEFVQDKLSKQPFKADANVAMNICELGLSTQYSIAVYPSSGTADGILGDHIILAPPFNVTDEDVHQIVQSVTRLVNDFFTHMEGQIYLN